MREFILNGCRFEKSEQKRYRERDINSMRLHVCRPNIFVSMKPNKQCWICIWQSWELCKRKPKQQQQPKYQHWHSALAFNLNESTERTNLRLSPLIKSIAFIFSHMFAFNFNMEEAPCVMRYIHGAVTKNMELCSQCTHWIDLIVCLFVCILPFLFMICILSFLCVTRVSAGVRAFVRKKAHFVEWDEWLTRIYKQRMKRCVRDFSAASNKAQISD